MLIWTRAPQTDRRNFLFLDRDGVINRDSPEYIKHWQEFHFYPDSLPVLRWLHRHAIEVILISNQSALNRGLMSREAFWEVHERMLHAIRQAGGDLLAAFYCPHRPDENCSCRKPAPGMILTAARQFGIALPDTAFIGDRPTDLLAATRAGCQGVWIERSSNGKARTADFGEAAPPVSSHACLSAAVSAIFSARHRDAILLGKLDSS